MRLLLPLFAASLLALPVQAQTTKPASPPTETTQRTAAPPHTHRTMQEKFDQANTTHDGHLMLEQSKSGYKSVARHFAAMDQAKKGYVTVDDVRAYYKAQRALHHQSASTSHHSSS